MTILWPWAGVWEESSAHRRTDGERLCLARLFSPWSHATSIFNKMNVNSRYMEQVDNLVPLSIRKEFKTRVSYST